MGLMVDLMKHQDTITWTAFEVSFAVQAAMGTVYAGFASTRSVGAALLGASLAAAFGLLIYRSCRYMTFYASKASELGLPQPKLWGAYSARWVMAATHVGLVGAWLIVASGLRVL
jgi:hypothetical protein